MHERADVVVIGAGIAGVTSALALQDAGFDVLVVEAADEIGGRIRTLRFPEPHEHASGELGAMRVLDEHHLTRRALERAGLSSQLVPFAPMFQDRNSLLVTAGAARRAEEVLTGPPGAGSGLATVQTLLDAVAPRQVARLAHGNDRLPALPHLTDSGPLPDRLVEHLSVCAGRLGVAMSSLAAVLRELAHEFKPAFTCLGGLTLLPRNLAELLERPVRHGCRLMRLVEQSAGVVAECALGPYQGLLRVRAAAAVCAVPAWLLSHVKLEGPVRSQLGADVSGRAPAGARKILMHLRRPVWHDEGIRTGGSAGGLLLRQVFYSPLPSDRRCDCAVLTLYASGRDTAVLDRIPAAKRLPAVLAAVERLHPSAGEPGTVLGHTELDWCEEPFARGAFDGDWRSGSGFDRSVTRTGRVVLAGDSRSRWPGWIEGAVTSGEQAAEILRSTLRTRHPPSAPTAEKEG
ncbi:flavin monoamine oxidase family protein [Streptomyces xanthochromogenes]|uniref:flavin monoamine oxidase family protein n=1 Tax=Streptomyces xanthochromogenes TaxID=67384 RepID=UPI00379A8191